MPREGTDTLEMQMLGRRKRRELGLTVRNIAQTAKALKDSGDITDDTDLATAAALVMDKIIGDNPELVRQPGFDWDKFLSFLEAVLAIILKFV